MSADADPNPAPRLASEFCNQEEILGFIERMKAKYTVAGATFSVPVSVENDANCAALAEVHMGMPEIAVTLPL